MKHTLEARTLAYRGRAAKCLLPALLALAGMPDAHAGATFKIDDTKWLSIGAGLRSSFFAQEKGAANGSGWSNNFYLDNMRLYVNAQVHKYIKMEFNTEVKAGTDTGDSIRVLDAVGKFEFEPWLNIWGGRMLVPAERRELNGPFYSAVYEIFSAGTPFESSDFNIEFKSNGTSAGAYGRDQGITVWGAAYDGGRFQYALGFFQGLVNGANQNDDLLYAQRVSYNFLEIEKNPGYYTSGTYYGKGGDILTLGASNQYQYHGAGTVNDPGSFRGTAVDLLFEKVLPNQGVVTFNGEYKNYGITGFNMASRRLVQSGAVLGFAMFEGQAYDFSLMYLFPDKVAIGQFQPYLRYVEVMPIDSSNRNNYEAGLNYIIDGHNANISLIYNYGDLLTKRLNYTDTVTGDHVSAVRLAFQLQI
jgi:hypothetical protein